MEETSIGCGGIRNTAVFDTIPAGGVSPQIEAAPLVNHTMPELHSGGDCLKHFRFRAAGNHPLLGPAFLGVINGKHIPIVSGGENPRIDGAGRPILASGCDRADPVVGMTEPGHCQPGGFLCEDRVGIGEDGAATACQT